MITFDDESQAPPPREPDLVDPLWFDPDALRESGERLYRYDGGDSRFYYRLGVGESGETTIRIYPSVTTVIRKTSPTSPFLLRWIAEYGERRANALRDERAEYGTLMHRLFARLAIEKRVDLDGIPSEVASYQRERGLLSSVTAYWAHDLQQDLVGFADFCRDHMVQPIGVEVPIASDTQNYAGCVDLAIRGTFQDGKGKNAALLECIAIVDWKSNRNAFYDDQMLQAWAYKGLWDEAFPDLKASRVLVYGAKNWDSGSLKRYRMLDCTALVDPGLFAAHREQYRLGGHGRHGFRLRFAGTLTLRNPDAAFVEEPLERVLIRRHTQKKETP